MVKILHSSSQLKNSLVEWIQLIIMDNMHCHNNQLYATDKMLRQIWFHCHNYCVGDSVVGTCCGPWGFTRELHFQQRVTKSQWSTWGYLNPISQSWWLVAALKMTKTILTSRLHEPNSAAILTRNSRCDPAGGQARPVCCMHVGVRLNSALHTESSPERMTVEMSREAEVIVGLSVSASLWRCRGFCKNPKTQYESIKPLKYHLLT